MFLSEYFYLKKFIFEWKKFCLWIGDFFQVVHWQSPNHHGFFLSGTSYPSILADILSDALAGLGFSWVKRLFPKNEPPMPSFILNSFLLIECMSEGGQSRFYGTRDCRLGLARSITGTAGTFSTQRQRHWRRCHPGTACIKSSVIKTDYHKLFIQNIRNTYT